MKKPLLSATKEAKVCFCFNSLNPAKRLYFLLSVAGRCAGMMGALNCKLPNGLTFSIGTGFSDAQRKKPPKIGSVITFKYQELSNSGHPR